MNILKLFIIIFCLRPSSISSNTIGLCGTELFHTRQNILNTLVYQLKNSDNKNYYEKQIINNFGLIGIENLIRYKENALKNIFYQLLKYPDFYVTYKSIYALRNFSHVDTQVLLPFLQSTNLLLKDMVISTLTELHDVPIIPHLEKELSYEKNIYIRQALQYALFLIKNNNQKIFPDFNYGIDTNNIIQSTYYKSGQKIENYKEKYSQIFLNEIDVPRTKHFIPPIIDYTNELIFKGKRISFHVGQDIQHAGDDCGWFREGSSVFSIAEGIIRLIHHSPDWGFLIVIEHKLSETNYICSVYGHLSREIYVHPGQQVEKGEKIGTIGLSYSIENGGYGAHLHFGISQGRWLKSKYNYTHKLSVLINNQEQNVKEYKITPSGTEITFENGITINLSSQDKSLNEYLFWLKGYAFSKDIDRLWLDPQLFLKEHQ